MTELLPCPFCGDEAEKGRQAVTQMNAERTTFDRIICRCCGAMAPELNWQKRAPSTPAADKEAMDMILAHAIPGAATQAPASGKASEPFLYAIMGPDGTAHIDEQCVSSARGDLDDTVFSLNEVSGPYRVVELFVPVQPAAAAPETFESFWAKLPIPGEYDNMDPIDQRRWRDVVRQAFDHVADANKMVAADLSDAERLDWIEKSQTSLYTSVHEERRPSTDGLTNYHRVCVFDGWAVGMMGEAFSTPREAIDAAMAANKERK